MHAMAVCFLLPVGSQDSSVGRELDLYSEGPGFNLLQEEWKDFLLCSLSLLTLIWCAFHPYVTAVALKKTLIIMPKEKVAGYT